MRGIIDIQQEIVFNNSLLIGIKIEIYILWWKVKNTYFTYDKARDEWIENPRNLPTSKI